jgi:hypothetical protein
MKHTPDKNDMQVLEDGNIFFVYQPKVNSDSAQGIEDTQRFYMILGPHGKKIFRIIVVGEKKLPEIGRGGQNWGFVDLVSSDAAEIEQKFTRQSYDTKTRGRRVEPAARPAGEGVYALIRHEDHTHLTYALELPERRGEVQKRFKIEDEGSYIVSIKNPAKSSPG